MSIPKVFISYSHLDEPWKDRLVKHLGIAEKQGMLQTWNDRNLLGGDDWFAEIINAIERGVVAVLLVSHNSLTSDFILNEEVPRMLSRHNLQAARFYPIVVEYCDWEAVEWLNRFNLRPIDGRPVGINKKGERTEEQINLDLAEIAREIRLAPPMPPAAPTPGPLTGECPYLGLEAFTEEKEHLFFGRADFVDAIFAKVKRQNFVALVGPSGCGKSSAVQAGLFPRLRHDTKAWVTSFFQPQENPFLGLAAEFIKHWQPQASSSAFINQAARLAAELKDARRLIEAARRTVAAPDGRLLLVVDQFEELFTLCDEGNRRAFLDVLLAAKDAAPVTILLTLRVDFMGQAQSFSAAFSQLLDESIVNHRPLTHAELEAVITGPTQYAGLEFEPGLVNLILREVAAQPDSLPLLEYALKEMWRERQSQVMGHALYETVGKVEGAISQHADAVLQALPEDERRMALRALTRLVRLAGEEGEADTRLRLPLSELSEAERAVLQEFVSKRLLVTKREEGTGAETIEVAHEALIRRWEKLREAVESDREFLMWRRRLNFRMREWESTRRDEGALLYGVLFEEAKRWLGLRKEDLTHEEKKFITWRENPEYQIERILLGSSGIVLLANEATREKWFSTLALCVSSEKAFDVARKIEDINIYGQALTAIAKALVKAGLTEEALWKVAEHSDIWTQAQILASVARYLIEKDYVSVALRACRSIYFVEPRAQALLAISCVLLNLGKEDEAWRVLSEALRAVRAVKDEEAQTRIRASVIKTFSTSIGENRTTQATSEMPESSETAETSPELKSEELAWGMAEILLHVEKIREAFKLPELDISEAMTTPPHAAFMLPFFRWADDPYDSARFLTSHLMNMVKNKDIIASEFGREYIGKIRDLLAKIYDEEKRSTILKRLSKIQAYMHEYREARETAEQCSRSSDKLAAYTAILREYHIKRDPNLARLFAEEGREED